MSGMMGNTLRSGSKPVDYLMKMRIASLFGLNFSSSLLFVAACSVFP
ncbi:MAG: hypothetical protein FD118_4250, partial [Rhodocyclaceae bacterium]